MSSAEAFQNNNHGKIQDDSISQSSAGASNLDNTRTSQNNSTSVSITFDNAGTSQNDSPGETQDDLNPQNNDAGAGETSNNTGTSLKNGTGKTPKNTPTCLKNCTSNFPKHTKRVHFPEFFTCARCKGPGIKDCDGCEIPSTCQHILHWDCIIIWYEKDDADPHDEWPCGCEMTTAEMEYANGDDGQTDSEAEG
jgi:hypothetical protein